MKKVILFALVALLSFSFSSCEDSIDCWVFTIKTKTSSKTTTTTSERCDLTEKEAELYRKFLEGDDKTGSTKSTTTVTKERKTD